MAADTPEMQPVNIYITDGDNTYSVEMPKIMLVTDPNTFKRWLREWAANTDLLETEIALEAFTSDGRILGSDTFAAKVVVV